MYWYYYSIQDDLLYFHSYRTIQDELELDRWLQESFR